MKKWKKTVIITIAVLFVFWAAMFITDLVRCRNCKEPVFVITDVTADNGRLCTYKGLGYRVEFEKHLDAEYGVKTDRVEMYLFGIMVLGIIVD